MQEFPPSPCIRGEGLSAHRAVSAVERSNVHPLSPAPSPSTGRESQKVAALVIAFLIAFAPIADAAFNKQWADDPAAYLSANPRAVVLIAESTDTATTVQDAMDEATRDAVGKIIESVQAQLQQATASSRYFDPQIVASGLVPLISQVTKDRIVETRDRPYGKIYSARLLVDTSPEAIELLTKQLMPLLKNTSLPLPHAVTERPTWASAVVKPAIMIGVVFLVCTILNFLTKGYYRGRLMILAGLAGIGLFLAAFAVFSVRSSRSVPASVVVRTHVLSP